MGGSANRREGERCTIQSNIEYTKDQLKKLYIHLIHVYVKGASQCYALAWCLVFNTAFMVIAITIA